MFPKIVDKTIAHIEKWLKSVTKAHEMEDKTMTAAGQSDIKNMHETEKKNISLCQWPKICDRHAQVSYFRFKYFQYFQF